MTTNREPMSKRMIKERVKISECTERFLEMIEDVKTMITISNTLSTQERTLLSMAYKNYIEERRQSLRLLQTSQEQLQLETERHQQMIREYRKHIKHETEVKCNELICLVTDVLLPKVKHGEERVFYLKMNGDYGRYICELYERDTAEYQRSAEDAGTSYAEAMKLAQNKLPAVHLTRLSLSLNYSVFQYEVIKSVKAALHLAQDAFDMALIHVRHINEHQYNECTKILELLRDNIQMWRRLVQQRGEEDCEAVGLE